MNKTQIVPFIAREDYDNFRRDIGLGAQITYAEWWSALSAQIEEARGRGRTVVMAEIIYDDFTDYCRANGCKPDQKMLLAFSRFKKAIDTVYPAQNRPGRLDDGIS